MKKNIFIFILFTYFFNSSAKVLIWDLGGLLFYPDKFGVAQNIGLKNFVSYMLIDFSNPNIENKLFSILEKLESEKERKIRHAETAEGARMPSIMCHWQAGTKNGYEIIAITDRLIEKLEKENYFKSAREINLIRRTFRAMFDPDILAQNVKPITKGLKLLQECYELKDKNGKRKHINIAFSNWDKLSFEKFYQQHKQHFSYFDHVIVSGQIGHIKPHASAYNYLINKLNLNPRDCILIDDQKINTDGAKLVGMQAIALTNNNYTQLRESLARLEVFSI